MLAAVNVTKQNTYKQNATYTNGFMFPFDGYKYTQKPYNVPETERYKSPGE